jgi:uncharacterized membrane protein
MPRQLLLLLHISGVIIWVGGMFFAYFCLRPAAGKVLEPPRRLPLWVATFEPFFGITAVAVAVILLTGFAMFMEVGFKLAPIGWQIMMSLGLLMTAIFAYAYGVLYPKLRHHCEVSAWPAAATVLNAIRKLVAANLVLAAGTVVAAVFSR